MPEKFKAPRGTFDVLPEQTRVRHRIVETSARVLEGAGYRRIDARSVGQSPPGRSVRPTEPWNSTSPENSAPSSAIE